MAAQRPSSATTASTETASIHRIIPILRGIIKFRPSLLSRGQIHLALIEGCKHSLEISIPVHEVESETDRVVADVMKRAKLPGFRPGKVPVSLVKKQFAADIRKRVLEALIPKFLHKQFEAENLNVVGTPDIKDVHYHAGEPLTFKAEFEVVSQIELQEYKDVEVPYHDPRSPRKTWPSGWRSCASRRPSM